MERRDILLGGLVLAATGTAAAVYRPERGKVLIGGKTWSAPPTLLPEPVDPAKRVFLSEDEARMVGAIFDRLIPADEISPCASDVGCVTFVDYQLAGPYGRGSARYAAGPFEPGAPYQGDQTKLSPGDYYKLGLPAVDAAARRLFGKAFVDCSGDQQDDLLRQMEAGTLTLAGLDATRLFQTFLSNVREGYFSDPIYGGNKGMVGWKMVGFPGARYDYRDFLDRKGQALDIPPVSLIGPIATA